MNTAWTYYPRYELRKLGITNDLPSYDEICAKKARIHQAYCKSKQCAGTKLSGILIYEMGFRRHNLTWCPRCGDALFWKMK